eukprot:COSAG01_NODE_6043_length_3882_cov_3.851042_1_plen_61_part_10
MPRVGGAPAGSILAAATTQESRDAHDTEPEQDVVADQLSKGWKKIQSVLRENQHKTDSQLA